MDLEKAPLTAIGNQDVPDVHPLVPAPRAAACPVQLSRELYDCPPIPGRVIVREPPSPRQAALP